MMENGSKGKRSWGNWFGYALLPFKIALRDDPLEYVKEAKATVDRKKRSFEALFTFTIAQLLIKFFGIKVHVHLYICMFQVRYINLDG